MCLLQQRRSTSLCHRKLLHAHTLLRRSGTCILLRGLPDVEHVVAELLGVLLVPIAIEILRNVNRLYWHQKVQKVERYGHKEVNC